MMKKKKKFRKDKKWEEKEEEDEETRKKKKMKREEGISSLKFEIIKWEEFLNVLILSPNVSKFLITLQIHLINFDNIKVPDSSFCT